MVGDFWNGFAKLGISHRDVGRMDWGKPIDVGSEPFQKVMTSILTKLDEDYFDIKRKNEAISVDDIMRDLQEVLQSDVLPKLFFASPFCRKRGVRTKSWTIIMAKEETAHVFSRTKNKSS
jgi:hypothetical protein